VIGVVFGNSVAVEKLFLAKITKNKITSGWVIRDLLELQDIFYPPNFGRLRGKVSFSTATLHIDSMTMSAPTPE
jgi:hypothetical protein